MSKAEEPLRGDAAWRAHKDSVAKNNEAAVRKGREQRAARDAVVEDRRRLAERRDMSDLPVQPETSPARTPSSAAASPASSWSRGLR